MVSETASALAAKRAWWNAFIVADTAYLEAHSAPQLSLTISGGQTNDRAAMIAGAETYSRGKNLLIDWFDEAAQFPEQRSQPNKNSDISTLLESDITTLP